MIRDSGSIAEFFCKLAGLAYIGVWIYTIEPGTFWIQGSTMKLILGSWSSILISLLEPLYLGKFQDGGKKNESFSPGLVQKISKTEKYDAAFIQILGGRFLLISRSFKRYIWFIWWFYCIIDVIKIWV